MRSTKTLQEKTESTQSVVEPLVVTQLTYDTVSGSGCSTGVRNRSLGRDCRSVRTDRRCRRTHRASLAAILVHANMNWTTSAVSEH